MKLIKLLTTALLASQTTIGDITLNLTPTQANFSATQNTQWETLHTGEIGTEDDNYIFYNTQTQRNFSTNVGNIAVTYYNRSLQKYDEQNDIYIQKTREMMFVLDIKTNINGFMALNNFKVEEYTDNTAWGTIKIYEMPQIIGNPALTATGLEDYITFNSCVLLNSITWRNTSHDVKSVTTGYNISQSQTAYLLFYAKLYDIDNTADGNASFLKLNALIFDIQESQIEITEEIIDIPGIMFTILGMPFTFISQAFNITLFPGTNYSINISQLFLSLMGLAILIIVIKKLVGR